VPSSAKGWDETYTYDCTSFDAVNGGNFITSITGFGGAQFTTDSGVNELGVSGQGVEHYFDTGTFNIAVDTECPTWTDTVTVVN
jgi:hypothetical protein